MKLLSIAVLLFVAGLARAAGDEESADNSAVKEKRGALPGYSSQSDSGSDSSPSIPYSKLAQLQSQALQSQQKGVSYVPASQGVQYISQPAIKYYSVPPQHQQQQQQQQFQYESQNVAYVQPQQHQPTKVAQYIQPQPQQPHYSSAADVSSFSYSSPVVKYSNLGVLSQVLGKIASQAGLSSGPSRQSSKSVSSSSPSSQVAYTHQIASLAPQPAAKGLYSSSAPSSPPAAIYQSQGPSQKYALVPQKTYQFASVPNTHKYSSSSGAGPATKYAVASIPVSAPQYQTISSAPQHSQGVQYSQASAAPQTYSFALPQIYSSALQHQAAQYISAASPGSHGSGTGPQTFADSNKDGAGQSASQGDEGQAYKQVYLAQPGFAFSPSGGQAYSAQAPSTSHTIEQPIYSPAPEYYSPQTDKYTPSRYVPAQ